MMRMIPKCVTADFFLRSKSCITCLAAGFSFLFSNTAWAQSERFTSHASFAEKIYLQLDADLYTTDQTIWFKAIVAEASTHRPTDLSGVLHVELIGPDEQIAERKRIKLTNGAADGGFELREHYTPGKYLLRAYTEWNKNFGADFIFHARSSACSVHRVQ